MLWKFSFATGSTLETLLSRETPPSVEELLDEQDILAECKAQNAKLVSYLSREDSVKSLLQWVTSGLDDLDEEADKAADAAYAKALASTDAYPPFRRLSATEVDVKSEDDDMFGIGLGVGLISQEEAGASDTNRFRYPQVAAEILTSELWTVPETIMNHKANLLRPFWDAVLPPISENKRANMPAKLRSERERARLTFWTEEDEERERKREVIRGLWMRVNASLLQKRSTEMMRFIQSLPNIVERMVACIDSPAIQDMLARIIQSEELGVSDVMSWLGEQRLVPRLLALLSPQYPPSTHAIVADLLKGIISVSAPNSSFNPHGGNAMDQQGGSGQAKDNRLVRELTNKESIATFISYLPDSAELTDRNWKGINADDGIGKHRSDPFVVHPLPSVASATSSLCYVCNIIVEVIRRNNSDLSEPYLFNTMRNRLMTIQSEQMRDRLELAPDEVPDPESDDDGRKKMEEALPELADKLAIVHLGNLVAAITDRFGQLHELLVAPRSQDRVASVLRPNPLTMERYRIIELYAELLHSSNMSTLNRVPGTGPEYTSDGALTGGLDGLDRLGQALQAGEAGEDAPDTDTLQVTQARELPVSSGSTDYSLTESDDVPLSDDEDAAQVTPTATTAPSLEVSVVPPPPSKADAERLRNVMGIDSSDKNKSETAGADSHVAVAATTNVTSISEAEQPAPAPADELSTGERLKQQFIKYNVLVTLLDLFFEHPNNNFLHHIVYDVLQQILNGSLGRGYNRELVLELFFKGQLIKRVLSAQKRNDEAVAARKPRLSYMGHISLIAEELIKFFARCPTDLADLIAPTFDEDAWNAFVDGSLRETRERDSQPLAGGKPLMGMESGISASSERSDSESDDDDEPSSHTIGEPLTRTVRTGSVESPYQDPAADDDGGLEFWRRSSGRAAAMDSSDDDDDDADWLRPSSGPRGGGDDDDDDFGAFQSTASADLDDDAWGSFTSVNASDNSENPFADAFAPAPTSSGGAASAYSSEPLTPRDWAEAFDREFEEPTAAWPSNAAEHDEDVPAIVVPHDAAGDGDDELGVDTPTSSWSFPGDESDDPGEDLPPTVTSGAAAGAGNAGPRGSASTATDLAAKTAALRLKEENDPEHLDLPGADDNVTEALASTSTAAHPLGPGVSGNTHVVGHMLERTMPDGSVVRVPEDDVALGINEAMEGRESDRPKAAQEPNDPEHLDLPGADDDTTDALASASSPSHPLGPGVTAGTHVVGNMLERTMPDGSVVRVPEDDIALGINEAMERRLSDVSPRGSIGSIGSTGSTGSRGSRSRSGSISGADAAPASALEGAATERQ